MNTEVFYKNKVIYYLNSALIKTNNVNEEQIVKIKELHVKKLEVFDKMAVENSVRLLRGYAFLIEQIESELQESWNFPVNVNFHEWYLVPQCSCNKNDNQLFRGTNKKMINSFCKVHN
jgi:hypothetical protein